jgi:hypothetical protein
MLHIDNLDAARLAGLISRKSDICVSIYIETTPLTQAAANDRIKLKNAAREAVQQLTEAGADKRRVEMLEEHIDDLVDDDEFWRFQAHSLAVLATPDNVQTYRLASRVKPMVAVSDRYHLGPLFRTASVGQTAYVLALSEGGARLVAVSPDEPAVEVRVEGMPKDAPSATGRASTRDRSPSGRLHGSEGQKVLLRQYARQADHAVGAYLHGQRTPLILAADTMLGALFRSVCSYPHLAGEGIDQSAKRMTPAELADAARPILDSLHLKKMDEWRETYDERASRGRASSQMEAVARAATAGAVDSLLIDIDAVIEGLIDDETGAITYAEKPDARHYDLIDEIAGRVVLAGGSVYGVRAADLPTGEPLAAILRFAV